MAFDPIAAETDGPFFRITCGYFSHKLLQTERRVATIEVGNGRREEKKRKMGGWMEIARVCWLLGSKPNVWTEGA